jgi:glycerol uptake facilitator-like aquaporin
VGLTVATTPVGAVGTVTGVAGLALGGSVTGALTWSHSWIYILTSILGGAAATALFVHLCAPHAEGD